MISAFYSGVFTLFYILLSIRVARARRGSGIGLGVGNNTNLQMFVRAHGNFSEYTPLFLILLLLLEVVAGYGAFLLNALAIAFLLGRISHVTSLVLIEKYENEKLKTHVKFRVIGMLATFSVLLISAICLILYSLKSLL